MTTAQYNVNAPTIADVVSNIGAVLDHLRPDGIDDLTWLAWRVETLSQVRAMLDREFETMRRVH